MLKMVDLNDTYGADNTIDVIADAKAAGYRVDEKGRIANRHFPLVLDGYFVGLTADGEPTIRTEEEKMTEKTWYDLDPTAAELWVVEGPAGLDPATIDPNCLPADCRWVSDAEWEAHPEMRP